MEHLTKSRQYKASRWISRVLAFFCAAIFALGVASAQDQTPPYLVNPIPEPGSVTSNWFLITTGVLDDESGVNPDPETVFVYINGSPPRVKPIIEPSYGDQKGLKITVILIDDETRGQVVVSVQAEDLAEKPNLMFSEWSFFVDNLTQNPVPVITYPENHRWLDFGSESGTLRYSWISLYPYPYFRMRFSLGNGNSATMDVGPFNNVGSIYNHTVSFDLERSIWSAVADAGELTVEIGPLDHPNGTLAGNYGMASSVTYVLEELPCLIRPYHSAVLDSMIPPVFEWSPLEMMAEEYVAVFVRLDSDGYFSNDVKVFSVPIFIKSIPMDLTLWNQFQEGLWAWTVLAKYQEDKYSDFMIQRFLKN